MVLAPLAVTVTITNWTANVFLMLSIRKPGVPIEHNLVSVTVIAPTALEADAWDTGLMVLGPEKAKEVVRREGLAVYMITKEGDSFKTWMSPQFKSFLVSEKKLKRKIAGFCVMVTGQTKGYP